MRMKCRARAGCAGYEGAEMSEAFNKQLELLCALSQQRDGDHSLFGDAERDALRMLLSQARSFAVSSDPRWPITLERRGTDAWAVISLGECLNREGEWEYEPLPSNRSEAFKARTWFPLGEAWERAGKALEGLKNGK